MQIDFKITTWERITVPQELEQEVIKAIASEEITCADDLFEMFGDDCFNEGILSDVSQQMTIEENDYNATIEVINDKGNKSQAIKSLLSDLHDTENFIDTTEKAGLVFTPNVNGSYGCYQVSNTLNTFYENKVSWFSGDIPKRDVYDEITGRKTGTEQVMQRDEFNKFKIQVQKDFKKDKYQILVATKAFGMGINKQNVFYTFHYGLPSSVEALYQEAGRAGRWDKNKIENKDKKGKCYVLYSPETHDGERVKQIFDKNTSFAEIKKASDLNLMLLYFYIILILLLFLFWFRFHLREEQYFLNCGLIGHQHGQTVDTDTQTGAGRHTEFQRAEEVFIHRHRLIIAALGQT